MKLGFIGARFIARFHAVAIHQVRGLEIAGLLKRRGAEALAGFCRERKLGEAKLFGSIAEMAKQVDVLTLYVPNYARLEVMEQIVAAVKAGAKLKGVILDKPLGRNMKEARRLVELAREAKLPTAYFENQIFLEKATASRGLLAVHYNEADLYGYTDENVDMLESFGAGRSAMLSWEYGLEVQRLVMASYLSAEKGRTIDLNDKATNAELDAYVPLLQQGKGGAQLLR